MSIFVIVIIAILLGLIIGVLTTWASEWIVAGIGAGIVGGIVCGAIIFGAAAGYTNPRDIRCFVEDKDRAKSDGGSDMRIYTKDCGVLKVQDLLWGRQFNSADIFSHIEPGHTYLFHVSGVRIPFFSVFPNVREVQRIS